MEKQLTEAQTLELREKWIQEAGKAIREALFKPHGYEVPEFNVMVSHQWNTRAKETPRAVGSCYDKSIADNDLYIVRVSPHYKADQGIDVLETIAHEMIHAMGIKGHLSDFREVALKIGFMSPMTTTPASPELKEVLQHILDTKLGGTYPQGNIDYVKLARSTKKQSTRLKKIYCQYHTDYFFYQSRTKFKQFGGECMICRSPMVMKQ